MDPSQIDRAGATWQHPVDVLEPEEESQRHKDRIRMLQVNVMTCHDEGIIEGSLPWEWDDSRFYAYVEERRHAWADRPKRMDAELAEKWPNE